MTLSNLPYPNVIEEIDYETLLSEYKTLFKENLSDEQITLLESDNYSALLEALCYRETLIRARINAAVKSMLLPYAQGADLDNVAAIWGIERLAGVKPAATVKFELTQASATDKTIPAGTTLTSDDGDTATLKEAVTIAAGETVAYGVSVLDECVESSSVKCEYIVTPLPFLVDASQETNFTGGAEVESDERFRQRAVLSMQRFSTAGASKAYIFHAMSANAKVSAVSVLNGGPGVVEVYLKTSDGSDVSEEVEEYLTASERRPLTDVVRVAMADEKSVVVKARVELEDLINQSLVDDAIAGGASSLGLGEDLNISYIYSRLHQEGVYRATITALEIDGVAGNIADVTASESEFISFGFEITYAEATL